MLDYLCMNSSQRILEETRFWPLTRYQWERESNILVEVTEKDNNIEGFPT